MQAAQSECVEADAEVKHHSDNLAIGYNMTQDAFSTLEHLKATLPAESWAIIHEAVVGLRSGLRVMLFELERIDALLWAPA